MINKIIELATDHPIIAIIAVCIIVLIIGSSRNNKREMERANDSWDISEKKQYALKENKRRRQDYHSNNTGWIIGIIFWSAILYGGYIFSKKFILP